MLMTKWVGALLVGFCLASSAGCDSSGDRWKSAQASAEKKADNKSDEKAADGATLNKFFPADGADGLKRVFDQEKEGFV